MDQVTTAPAGLGFPPFDLAAEFSRFRQNWPAKLHFAAHSHHFWPDATREAHLRAWDDAARLVDGKWQEVLGPVWQKVAQGVAKHLNLPVIDGLVPANNTHEFVNRLLSCLPRDRKPRVLTSDAEFHSFRRQIERLAEDGLIELTVVPAEPFAGLAERLIAAAQHGPGPDMVFVSQVHFNSGYALTDLETLVDGVAAPGQASCEMLPLVITTSIGSALPWAMRLSRIWAARPSSLQAFSSPPIPCNRYSTVYSLPLVS